MLSPARRLRRVKSARSLLASQTMMALLTTAIYLPDLRPRLTAARAAGGPA